MICLPDSPPQRSNQIFVTWAKLPLCQTSDRSKSTYASVEFCTIRRLRIGRLRLQTCAKRCQNSKTNTSNKPSFLTTTAAMASVISLFGKLYCLTKIIALACTVLIRRALVPSLKVWSSDWSPTNRTRFLIETYKKKISKTS